MKKLLSLTLALCMALTLVACGSKEEAKAPSAPSAPAKTETKTETKTEAPSEPEAFELNGPVTFIVPYATGGSADTAGRLVAQYLGEVVGQQINVVNKEGASGVVGSVELSQAKQDGYTIGVASVSDLYVADYRGTFDINSVDFINWYLSVPLALYSSPNSPWNDFSELIADIKAGKDKFVPLSLALSLWPSLVLTEPL